MPPLKIRRPGNGPPTLNLPVVGTSTGRNVPAKTPVAAYYIGIDPGLSGGLVCLETGLSTHQRYGTAVGVRSMVPMPETERDILTWLMNHARPAYADLRVHAVIELVGGYMGGESNGSANRASGHTMFRFGANYGAIRMGLLAAGIPFEEAVPTKWQKAFGLKKDKGEKKTAWKNRCKAKAQQLYPSENITLAVSDACLIADYCKRKCEGTL